MSAKYLLLAPFLLESALSGTLYAGSFSSLSPFSACNLKSPSSVITSDGNAVFYFDESDFDGTRDDKGVEICVFEEGTSTNIAQMTKEGWQGFNLYVSSDSFPTNRSTIIAQQFCPGGCSSWCGGLQIVENALVAEHRAACGDATMTTLVADIERETWHEVVVHMRVSQEGDGAYEVWWDGTQVYSVDGIDVGFGTWDGDALSSGWYFKNGIYAFDTEDYVDGTTRALLFDNVSWYETDSGETDGYDTVAPGNAS
ncbi:polysaccharide lyase-domain-containing protein [Aspergillus ambiguus]|uniref:polysaccharide lyase-domain-containing protein n=1 Tax=Aspergillus ambiguus TaxID=176160 RepID=UPI003CCCB2B3